MNVRLFLAAMAVATCAAVAGCSDPKPTSKVAERPSISQRVRIENLHARVERSDRISETETVKVVIVPGYPFGNRCVVYTNATSSSMTCSEITPSEQ